MSEQDRTEMSLRERLLHIPIFYKILIANSAIVVFGAIAGTIITVWYVAGFFSILESGLIVLFAVAGTIISFLVNNWVLKRALEPLDRLQNAVDEVRGGDTTVRVNLGANSDDRFDRLADTFNQMLNELDTNSQRMQKLSRMILNAQEEERHRLARDLHDEAAQALTSLLVHLRLLERAGTAEEAQQRVHELRELTAFALEDVRRVAVDLRPTILDDLGLAPALEWRVDEFNKTDDIQATFSAKGLDKRLPRDMELVLYRIGQEALNNIGRHAAASTVQVTLIQSESDISLAVADDGLGFDPMAVQVDAQHGLGLEGMRERIGMIGGDFVIDSALGQGTLIRATAPLPNCQRFGVSNGENSRSAG